MSFLLVKYNYRKYVLPIHPSLCIQTDKLLATKSLYALLVAVMLSARSPSYIVFLWSVGQRPHQDCARDPLSVTPTHSGVGKLVPSSP